MRVRTLLIATAIVSAVLGAVVAYLVLTVPNDLQSGALLRTAQKQVQDGDIVHARESLSRVVQQYPRTDAAAAAVVALTSLSDRDRQSLIAQLGAAKRDQANLQKQLSALNTRVLSIENKPAPAPVIIREPAKTIIIRAPAAKAPVKKAPTTRKR